MNDQSSERTPIATTTAAVASLGTVDGATDSHVEVEAGVRLHVREIGGDGLTVVFVAGFGLDHTVWEREVRLLAKVGYRVICIDQRGHGLSDKPAEGYSIPRLVEDLSTVLARLEIGTCILVGWSFGGQVAFHAAATRRGLVSRLVLVGSNGVRASRSEAFPFGAPPESLLGRLTANEISDRVGSRRDTIASGFNGVADSELVDRLLSRSLLMPSTAALACYHSMLETDLLEDIDSVRMPVLQIIGREDPVHSAKGARWLNERLVDATLIAIPDCGHYPMFEAPEAFDSILLDFIGRTPGSS